ncbi:cytochrome c oxidase subunit 3 [Halalkalicoccus subterraneus]|uniref:cytochrome c oxidase subunit 3 n=1 Tax=Halalkalicoccus subterraneus TaxID=2675002 RepID=UPI000EFB9B69|nr:heme-copper oxidase subunit III [Halalkalicoccus subterraneus]
MTVSEDSGDDHGHHLPAVEDWPKGFGEASWWPFITAIGASGIYVGAALTILSLGGLALAPIVGGGVFAVSVATFLAGLYGWTYHAFVKAFWDAEDHGNASLRWGMVLFLCTEVATFGAVFVYYFHIRIVSWPPADFEVISGPLVAGTVTLGSVEIPIISEIVLANTLILVLSSGTIHWAHSQLLKDNHRNFTLGLAATFMLGVVFLIGQSYEYYEFIVHEGFTLAAAQEALYASAFYGLTGLHGLHVSMGAVLIGILLLRALYGQYSSERHTSVSTVSMYWHFVDVVWIFLVVVLYLGAVI